jgi:hypothetical protein
MGEARALPPSVGTRAPERRKVGRRSCGRTMHSPEFHRQIGAFYPPKRQSRTAFGADAAVAGQWLARESTDGMR